MEDTIKIQTIDRSDWTNTLQGFDPNTIEQIFGVYGVDGSVIGVICTTLEGKYYINGQPDVDYPSLETAAGALVKGE